MKYLLITAAVLCSTVAAAHEWYPPVCCSDKDCFPVPSAAITATSKGWRYNVTGEVIPYGSTKIRSTPAIANTPYHICTYTGKVVDGIRCLFVPGMGS